MNALESSNRDVKSVRKKRFPQVNKPLPYPLSPFHISNTLKDTLARSGWEDIISPRQETNEDIGKKGKKTIVSPDWKGCNSL